MHIDLETPALPSTFKADVCIVGGGTSGILLAWKLACRGRQILLLEAGGLTLEERSQELYAIDVSGESHAGILNGRFRTFGGASTRWGGGLLPYTRDVLQPPPCLGLPSWPIDLQELEPYYEEVQRIMGVTLTPFSSELLRHFKRSVPFSSDRVRLRLSKSSPFTRRNLSRTLGKKCLASSRIAVVSHANAIAIELLKNGRAVSSVTAVNYGGKRFSFEAGAFILCTGTIETSRLLLASTSVCSRGVGNERDQVGRYFHDHVFSRVAEIAPQDRGPMITTFAHCMGGNTLHKFRLEATERLRRERGLLSVGCEFPVEEPPESGVTPMLNLLRSVQRSDFTTRNLRDLLSLPSASREVAQSLYSAKIRKRRYVSPHARIIFHVDVEQRPDPESRVRLSEEPDAVGMRKAILHWKISNDEHRSIGIFAQEVAKLFRNSGLATTCWGPATRRSVEPELLDRKDSFHMMGGARMGSHPGTSVVNRDLRVHGIDNLHIVSCAVFPTGGSSNPTFTLLALALRLADTLETR